MKKLTVLLLMFCLMTSLSHATEYAVLKESSAIMFKVKRGLVHMRGRVFNYDVTFEYNSEDPYSWRIEAEMPVEGIQLVDRRLDQAVKQDGNLFKVIEYPVIYFDSREVVSADAQKAVVKGMLSVNGIEKEATLNITINGENSFEQAGQARKVIGVFAETTISRADFDILWPAERKKKATDTFFLADEIQFEFEMLGVDIR